MAQTSFVLVMLAIAGGMALVLGVIGVYGVIAYTVEQRRREVGIRMALGAPAGAIRSMIVRDGARLVVTGVALGLVGAFSATRFLRSLLFGVSTTEPVVFTAAAVVIVGTAMLASYIPARAATHADPLEIVKD
jgi:ABC-type antimicrobial peptide transport system permease subunit